jgi:hypothetical protein
MYQAKHNPRLYQLKGSYWPSAYFSLYGYLKYPVVGCLLLLAIVSGTPAFAQTPMLPVAKQLEQPKKPFMALTRSLIVPGWGHWYADGRDSRQAKWFLAADLALLAGTLGYHHQSQRSFETMTTVAQQQAGVDIRGRSTSFLLAVAQFNSLEAYNQYQEQTRNWHRFLTSTPENQWEWTSESERLKYNDVRSTYDNSKRQRSIFIGTMVLNRLVSGVSAAVAARNHNRRMPELMLMTASLSTPSTNPILPWQDPVVHETIWQGRIRFAF